MHVDTHTPRPRHETLWAIFAVPVPPLGSLPCACSVPAMFLHQSSVWLCCVGAMALSLTALTTLIFHADGRGVWACADLTRPVRCCCFVCVCA